MQTEGIYMRADDKNSLITKGNELIEARYKLSLNQQRLLLALSTQVHQEHDDFHEYIVKVDDVAKMWGIESGKATYARMEEAVKDLIRTDSGLIYLEEKSGKYTDVTITRWVSSAQYRKGSGTIKISFDKSVKDFFIQLKEKFTQYHLSAVVRFKSSYSIRIYELLKLKQNMGKGGQFWRELTLLELREKLGIEENTYPKFKDLRVWVIEPALKEIHEHSDISIVQVDYEKEGRAFAKIKITAEPKNQLVIDYDDTPEAQKEQAKNTRKLPKVYDELLAVGISDTTARNWIKKYGTKRIARNLAYTLAMKQTTEIGNIGAYMAKIISQDIGEMWAKEQEKQAENLKKRKQAESKQDEQYEEQKRQGKAEKDKMIAIFDTFNDDEKGFYLDELEQRFKGLKKAKFELARQSYINTKSTAIFSEFFLDIRDLLGSHNLL
ncbi:MAG: RepB family plasmid replication initiator protein [Candidatus Moraniibacteriota bacterium]|nr:MAG: RepB family plasmid replication initiator protein [Candidatus Moranbacteria bacterium]